jgi:predicted transcriptional regulator
LVKLSLNFVTIINMETLVELSERQLEALAKLSKERQRSKSALITQAVEEYLEKNASIDLELQTESEMKSWHDDAREIGEIEQLEKDLPTRVLEDWHRFVREGAKPARYVPGQGIVIQE